MQNLCVSYFGYWVFDTDLLVSKGHYNDIDLKVNYPVRRFRQKFRQRDSEPRVCTEKDLKIREIR